MGWRYYGNSKYEIKFNVSDNKIIRVKNDSGLQTAISEGEVADVASFLKTLYKSEHGEAINIATGSLAIEIVGHVYPGKLFAAVQALPVPKSVKEFCKNLSKRTDIVDCGESSVDSNRFVWDTLYAVTTIDIILV